MLDYLKNHCGQAALALGIASFLTMFLVIPVLRVIGVAFLDASSGQFTLVNFQDFFNTSLFMESFWNSLYVAGMSVVVATVFSLPLAYFTTRFNFRGSALVQALGVIPLVMPAFVGAVAMQLLFGRNGSVNIIFDELFGFTIPFMEGLNGVVFVQSLHYFPFILINLSASLVNIDRSMEEAAQNLGCGGFRLFRRIVFPLAMPGYAAGAALVFIKVFDDLGTPLLLNVNKMLAPQAYLRISSIGINDPMGYVISVMLIAFSLLALWVSSLALRGKDYATTQRGGGGLAKREMRPWEKVTAYSIVLCILVLVLSPHLGLLLLSFGTIWSFAILPDGYTLSHYADVFSQSPELVTNTITYASLAAGIDVILGTAIAYLVFRTRLPGRKWLDYAATAPLAIPGVVLAIGFLRSFYSVELPFGGGAMATWWGALVLALAVRRLPYAMRACSAALHQVHISLEEAAESLGAGKARIVSRIVVPLMSGGILAGFVTSFITAAVELSATIMLVSSESDAPLSYGIYVFMQSAAGRGPGAALGITAVVVVAIGTYLTNRLVEKHKKEYGMGQGR